VLTSERHGKASGNLAKTPDPKTKPIPNISIFYNKVELSARAKNELKDKD